MTRRSTGLEPLAIADPLARVDLFRALEHEYFVWDAFVAGRRRVDLHPIVLSGADHEQCVQVATNAWTLACRAAEYAFGEPRERARYGLPPDVERLARAAHAAGGASTLVRVDLLQRDDGRFVACEINADCPGGHNEALGLPALAARAGHRSTRPLPIAAHLLAERLVALSGGPGSPKGAVGLVFATGYADDLQVCALVEKLVRARGGRTMRAPVTALREVEGHVAIGRERVSVLYRFYPMEAMADLPIGPALAAAIEAGTLVTVSSFASIYAQSKLSIARAFAIDAAASSRVFPATLAFGDVDRDVLRRERARWVVKRDLSRVGDHVLVGELFTDDDFALALAAVDEAEGEGERWIAQRFVPQRLVPTPWGDRWLTLGVYLFDGAFAGYFARLASTSLCTHDALAVPVFVEDDA